jgi:GNAT superfamily N-acetyltransferase
MANQKHLEIANQYTDSIDAIYKKKDLHIRFEETEEKYIFTLYHNDKSIGTITIYIEEEEVPRYLTRSGGKRVEEYVYKIPSIIIDEEHRGHNYATQLLLYSLCTLYKNGLQFQYVSLDDTAKHPLRLDKNLYHRLGFVHKGCVAFNLSNSSCKTIERGKWTSDDEKMTTISHLFRAIISREIRRKSRSRSPRKGGRQQRRKTSKQHKHRKQ